MITGQNEREETPQNTTVTGPKVLRVQAIKDQSNYVTYITATSGTQTQKSRSNDFLTQIQAFIGNGGIPCPRAQM
jgi:hypothetical protein